MNRFHIIKISKIVARIMKASLFTRTIEIQWSELGIGSHDEH